MTTERRSNHLHAEVVRKAIEIDRTEGCISAWLYATSRGISTEILMRVMSEKPISRESDQPAKYIDGHPWLQLEST